MCGIIGYKSIDNSDSLDINEILLNGLKRLEYRGYDSWGMAILNDDFHVTKQVGGVGSVNNSNVISGFAGIAHTRWATHGGVSKRNAHPHVSCDGNIYVVHNGIVENYRELKNILSEKGHTFKSQTDTEVISHLIEEYNKEFNFEDSVRKAVEDLEGQYAICVISKSDNKMIASRHGSPLVLGLGDDGFYVASDIPAFLDKTKRVIYLQDDDFVILDDNFTIRNIKNDCIVERPIDTVDWDIEQVKKGEFEHFMLKEISEQYQTLKNVITQDLINLEGFSNIINESKEIVLLGCGTSYHACLTAKHLFSKICNKRVNVCNASEFKHEAKFFGKDSVVIAVTQSGETADVLDAIKEARNNNAKVLSITNVMGSSVTRYSDATLYLNAGPEICVLATKSYTSQLATLLLVTYSLAGKINDAKAWVDFTRNELYKLTARSTRNHIANLAEKIKDKDHMFIIGRGINHSSALEAALKIKEVSYIHAEGFAGGELKHGSIALIEEGTPCVIITGDEGYKEAISNAEELKARGGFIIGVAPENSDVFDFFIKTPECGITNPIVHAIPMQILAYQLAILKGLDPDKPRNLAKSVTVR